MDNDIIPKIDKYKQENLDDKHTYFSDLSHLPSFFLKWIDCHTPHLICLWDEQANLLFITKSAESMLGYKPSELLGTQWKQLLQPKSIRNIYRHIDEDFSTNNFHITAMNHKKIPIQFQAFLEKEIDETNNVPYFIGLFKKIPLQNKNEEIMIQSEKMSVAGQLAAGIAHEIRNPLTSLKGFLQLLQAGIKDKEIYYQIMTEEIDKIEMITSELLFISRPLTDEKNVESIHSMVKDVTLLLESQARLKNIHLKQSIPKRLSIYCNRSQVKQVLINIIKNAIESMEHAGEIMINARLTEQKMIEVDIIDQGPGISEQMIKKIGEPFFTTKQSGTGLGLMITEQILEKQYGRLRIVESNHSGSTFRIIFPEP